MTFSGVLNALDGVAAGEERILFMTTNHIERLDPALIRPGRVDLTELFDHAVPDQVYDLCTMFYGKSSEETGRNLASFVSEEMNAGRRISMAELQGMFIQTHVKDVLSACRELYKHKFSMTI